MVWGIVMFIIFLACYLGQSVSSGLEGKQGWTLQWACWLIASVTMWVCYMVA